MLKLTDFLCLELKWFYNKIKERLKYLTYSLMKKLILIIKYLHKYLQYNILKPNVIKSYTTKPSKPKGPRKNYKTLTVFTNCIF